MVILNVASLFRPSPTLTEKQVNAGLRWMTWEGVMSMGFGSMTTSGFLAAYALLLGANFLQVGILAALPFLSQPLQIPTILLVEKLRVRKALAVPTWLISQAIWVPVALIPLFISIPSAAAVHVLLGLVALRSLLSAVTNCSWNSWVRDLVPQHILGRFFARRLMYANVMAMVFGLAAAVFVDYWGRGHPLASDQAIGYTIALVVGALTLGMASPLFMLLMPEPRMQDVLGERQSLLRMLWTPVRDSNYKHLVRFQLFWNLALWLAIPFFAVYMLERLGLPLSAVIGFSVLAQAANVFFLRAWGPLADSMGSKAVLQLSASLYLLVILGWTFTTFPERYALTVPLLVVLHILAGAAAAGVNLTAGTIALKIAPQGQATPYLAVNSLAANLGAGLGPLIGGAFAVFFSTRQLNVNLEWVDPSGLTTLPALSLTGFDFLFGVTFVLGLVTVNTLTALREEGESSREVALDALMAPMRQVSAPMSSVPGVALLTQFPYGYLRRAPLPGLDVAFGVTAYQIAETARVATVAAGQGRRTLVNVARSIEDTVSGLWKAGTEDERGMEAELAHQAARGAVLATSQVDADVSRVSSMAMEGAVAGIAHAGAEHPEQAILGAAYGAVEGALEAGEDPVAAALASIEAARRMAAEVNLSPAAAARLAAEGALQAVGALASERLDDLRSALPEDAKPLSFPEAESAAEPVR